MDIIDSDTAAIFQIIWYLYTIGHFSSFSYFEMRREVISTDAFSHRRVRYGALVFPIMSY